MRVFKIVLIVAFATSAAVVSAADGTTPAQQWQSAAAVGSPGVALGDGLRADPSGMDCNGNGSPDNADIADGTSFDLNGNGVPDECDAYLASPLLESGRESRPPGAPCACPPIGTGATAPSPMATYLPTGEFVHSVVDLQIRGRGIDFVWARTYRSRHSTSSSLGLAWDYSYNIWIAPAGPDFLVHDGNAREDLYEFDPPRNSWSNPEFDRELIQNPDLSYTMIFADTGTWNFYPLDGSPFEGKISSIADRNGNTLYFGYDLAGRLVYVIDTLGRPITIEYDGFGYISSVIDFATDLGTNGLGRVVEYSHYLPGDTDGPEGALRSVTMPAVLNTPTGNDFPLGKTTIYTYSTGDPDPALNNNLLTITDPTGQLYLQNFYSPNPSPTSPEYDRLTKQIWGNPGLDEIDVAYIPQVPSPVNGNAVMKAVVNDRVGNVEEYFYDAQNRGVIRREYSGRAPNPAAETDDFNNRPVGKLRASDPDYFETRWEYNASSLPSHIVRQEGNETFNSYDELNASPRSRGNLMTQTKSPGPRGGLQPILTESYQYDLDIGPVLGTNFVTQHTDARGHTTFNTYDPQGNKMTTQERVPGILETWEYNGFGQVTAHILPDNGSGHLRRDEFTYYNIGPSNGYLQSEIVDATGFALTTTYEYDVVGNVTRVVDPNGQDTQFVVNALNQPVRQISRELAGGFRISRDTYYDENDNVIREEVENRDDNGTLQPNTFLSTEYEYDVLNTMTRTTQEVDLGHQTVTEYEYDANRNRTLVRSAEATNGDQPGNVTQTLYDERDLVFQTIRAPGEPEQSTSQNDYDGNGNLALRITGLESTSPRETTYQYDGYDRQIRTTDPMGNETLTDHDENGNVAHEMVLGELFDEPGGAGNVRLSEVTYAYDEMDRKTTEAVEYFDTQTQAPLPPGQLITQTSYNDNSQVVLVIDPNGREIGTQYDTANRKSRMTDPEGNSVVYGYDNNSNVLQIDEEEISQVDGLMQTFLTVNAYDALDRLTSTTDNAGNTTQYAYDSRGNRVVRLDARGIETRYEYDGLNRLISTTYDMNSNGASPGDPADVTTIRIHDDNGRLAAIGDDNGHVTNYSYDGLDHRIETVYADGTSVTNTYDVHGNKTSTTDANGTVVTYTHDLLNRTQSVSVTPAPGVSNATTFELYVYDGLSRIVLAQDDDSLVERQYDSASHVTMDMQNGVPVQAEYDASGNQTALYYPGGRIINSTFDGLNRRASVTEGPIDLATYRYAGAGRLVRRDLANNVRSTYEYDAAKNLFETTHTFDPDGLPQLVAGHTYTWDAVGNKTGRLDLWDGSSQTFTYDAMSRLLASTGGPAGLRVYMSDGANNFNNVLGGPPLGGVYSRDASPAVGDYQMNQYSSTPSGDRRYDRNGSLIGIGPAGTGVGDCNGDGFTDEVDYFGFAQCLDGPGASVTGECFCYDIDGDTDTDLRDFFLFQQGFTGGGVPTSGIHIKYDYRRQMVEYFDANTGLRHRYSYDPLGRRIGKVVDVDGVADETHYYYNGWQVIEERDGFGITRATYVYGDNYIDALVSMQRNGIDYYFHTDDQYNTVALTLADGTVAERYKYDDYGAPFFFDAGGAALPESLVGNPMLFTGRRYDPETGWYHYRTRYLDPSIGRFTTRDVMGIWGDPANVGNGYAYVGNNPWSRLDPGGLCPPFWWWRWTYWPAWWVSPWAWYPMFCGWYPYYWYWYPYGWWYRPYMWHPYYIWWSYPYNWWWYGWGWGWWHCPSWWWSFYRWWWYPYRWWWYPYGYWYSPWSWYWYSYRWWYCYDWWYPYGWWCYPYYWGWGWYGWWGWYYPYYSWWWYPYTWWWYGYGPWWYWGWGWGWYWCYPWWYWYGLGWYWYDWCYWPYCWWGWYYPYYYLWWYRWGWWCWYGWWWYYPYYCWWWWPWYGYWWWYPYGCYWWYWGWSWWYGWWWWPNWWWWYGWYGWYGWWWGGWLYPYWWWWCCCGWWWW